jgi:hypothetical protein
MNVYQELRIRARQKRDEAVRDAQSIYKQIIKRIELVERSLGCPLRQQPVTPESVAQSIMRLMVADMPKDRAFEGGELAALLRDRYPERQIDTRTVRTYLHRLSVQGLVRRVSKPNGRLVQWAARECPIEVVPDEAAALVNVTEVVLRESGPLNLMQLTLAMQKHGTRPELKPRSLMEALRRSLCYNQGRFLKGRDGRWGVA